MLTQQLWKIQKSLGERISQSVTSAAVIGSGVGSCIWLTLEVVHSLNHEEQKVQENFTERIF